MIAEWIARSGHKRILRHGFAIALAAAFSSIPINATIAQTAQTETSQTETTSPEPEVSQQGQEIAQELEARINTASTKALRERLTAIRDHYAERNFDAIWIENGEPTEKARAVSTALNRASEHGLKSEDYDADRLFQELGILPIPNVADLEVHISTALVSYAQHLNAGRVNPAAVTRENVIYPDQISANEILNSVRKTSNIIPYLRLLAPRTPRYDRLRNAMRSYRRMAENGGWPVIPEGETLKPGMSDPRVLLLRERLTITGEYVPSNDLANPETYEGDIVDAVQLFQERHGLEIDGVIGSNTLKEINVSVDERIAMMELNLERRRWMQNDYGQNHIFANLADQVLKLVRNGKTVYAEIIQVGLPYHKTPVFSDSMEYLEFNPYWNVPYSIATKELLPKLKRNANHFTPQGYEVLRGGQVINASAVPWNSYSRGNFPVRIRQRPGANNALGRVKFMFPNKHNIYIHDTPSKSKFNNASRLFSHGCLRLRDPFKFAEALLGVQGWDRARIDRVVNSKKRTVVKLDEEVPVHIAYLTSWVNKDGSVHFRRDVYDRDTILAAALENVRGR